VQSERRDREPQLDASASLALRLTDTCFRSSPHKRLLSIAALLSQGAPFCLHLRVSRCHRVAGKTHKVASERAASCQPQLNAKIDRILARAAACCSAAAATCHPRLLLGRPGLVVLGNPALTIRSRRNPSHHQQQAQGAAGIQAPPSFCFACVLP
jgi:hypothetical protein